MPRKIDTVARFFRRFVSFSTKWKDVEPDIQIVVQLLWTGLLAADLGLSYSPLRLKQERIS